MTFNSIFFGFFLLVALIIFYQLKQHQKKTIVIINLLFYCFYDIFHTILLFFLIVIDYLIIKWAWKENRPEKESAKIIYSGIVFNLVVLVCFKYLFTKINPGNTSSGLEIVSLLVLPLGMSFYIFKKISFLFDYLTEGIERIDFWDYTGYVTYFPQIFAGPIERYQSFADKHINNKSITASQIQIGLLLITAGLFYKNIIADNINVYCTRIFDLNFNFAVIDYWIGIFAYSTQIFADFFSYSLMSGGISIFFGYNFIENFQSPYTSVTVTDFWRRWHISLSSWLRDYIFIPLSFSFRHLKYISYCLPIVVMLVSGIWHGEGLNFVLWGGVYGIIIAFENIISIERRIKNSLILKAITSVFVFVIVTILWVLFKNNLTDSLVIYSKLLGIFENYSDGGILSVQVRLFILLTTVCTVIISFYFRKPCELIEKIVASKSLFILSVVFLFVMSVIMKGKGSDFIYFRF